MQNYHNMNIRSSIYGRIDKQEREFNSEGKYNVGSDSVGIWMRRKLGSTYYITIQQTNIGIGMVEIRVRDL